MNRIYDRSASWILKTTANVMETQIMDFHLDVKKALLQNTFNDLSEHWPDIPKEPQCIQLLAPYSEIQCYSQSFRPFCDLILNEAKLHYSERILDLARRITETHAKDWEEASTSDSLKELRNLFKLNDDEQRLVRRFNLEKVFISATEQAAKRQEYNNKILVSLQNIRNKLPEAFGNLKQLDPFYLKFDSSYKRPSQ